MSEFPQQKCYSVVQFIYYCVSVGGLVLHYCPYVESTSFSLMHHYVTAVESLKQHCDVLYAVYTEAPGKRPESRDATFV